MAVNEITVGRGYPLPHPDNLLDEDVQRIRNALSAVDSDVAALIALGLLAGRFNGSLTITGDLFVEGERVAVEAATLEVADNRVVLNKGEMGPGVTAGEAGLEVDRGSLPSYRIVFVEGRDAFCVGEAGQEQAVATRQNAPTAGGYARWNAVEQRFDAVPAGTVLADAGAANVIGKTTTFATRAPLPTDDGNAGYVLGSRWINTTAKSEFVCMNPAIGAAAWSPVASGGLSLSRYFLSM